MTHSCLTPAGRMYATIYLAVNPWMWNLASFRLKLIAMTILGSMIGAAVGFIAALVIVAMRVV